MRLWREARQKLGPVEAWASIVEDPAKARSYKSLRGMGGFVRSTWDEAQEIIAAANVYTIRKYGPDRVIGFSPIPAMSMVSYAAGSRYLSLIGGVCMSFYDWYCDLPPSSPQTWGEQTDVPESADWYNSTFIMAWGSNVPQTRTPDAHFFTEVRYKGAKIVAVTPDYAEVSKLADLWLHPQQGTDAALAMAMGHVVLKEFHFGKPSAYFVDYCRRYTDMPVLVKLVKRGNQYVPDRYVRASECPDQLGQANNPEWKVVVVDETSGRLVAPQGSIGYRWGQKEGGDLGKWNLEPKDGATGAEIKPALSLIDRRDESYRSHSRISRGSRLNISRPTSRVGTSCCATFLPGACSLPTARRWSRPCTTSRLPTTASTGDWAAPTSPSRTTRICPTRRNGRKRSPASRRRTSSRSHGSSRTTPTRRRASRW